MYGEAIVPVVPVGWPKVGETSEACGPAAPRGRGRRIFKRGNDVGYLR